MGNISLATCQGRGHGFDPWAEKIPCASGHLRPSDTATKPKCQEPVPHEASHRDERPAQAVKAPNSQKSKYVHEYTTFFFLMVCPESLGNDQLDARGQTLLLGFVQPAVTAPRSPGGPS